MLDVIRGTSTKPVATKSLVGILESHLRGTEGLLYVGYPIIATSIGSTNLDVVLVTPEHGMIIFDIVEGTTFDVETQALGRDEIYLNVTSRLIQTKPLTKDRQLGVGLSVVTFAPAVKGAGMEEVISSNEDLVAFLDSRKKVENQEYFIALKSAVQTVTKLKAGRKRSNVTKANSRGARLNRIEESIAHLDSKQNRAVVETVEGPQRIRGLAGSGKTIILALKAAYLHSVYPDWKIAVTYSTRSLHGQFKELITKFTIEQKGEDPDWEKLKIIPAWGGQRSTGIYYEFCESNGLRCLDYRSAVFEYGRKHPFAKACEVALQDAKAQKEIVTGYDAILIDEAQDFAYPFLQLCYAYLPNPKRLVWAYDELQNLEQFRMPSPKELFGVDLINSPDAPHQDIILDTCYRNPGPVLATAHSLGFGITREEGLVQMFDEPSLWNDIGYKTVDGKLEKGSVVTLERTKDSSPEFLEDHSEIDDLIVFRKFESIEQQAEWVTEQICHDIEDEELVHKDIIVINLDPLTALDNTALLRSKLFEKGIRSHVPGKTTLPDIFFQDDSISFTSIYRAKGNEAPMIYIMDAELACSETQLVTNRNKLFSAITRSKAWVRVTGRGEKMEKLISEYDKIKKANFKLTLKLPTDDEMAKLRVINRDLSNTQLKEREEADKNIKDLLNKLQKGQLKPEELESIGQLKMFLDEQES